MGSALVSVLVFGGANVGVDLPRVGCEPRSVRSGSRSCSEAGAQAAGASAPERWEMKAAGPASGFAVDAGPACRRARWSGGEGPFARGGFALGEPRSHDRRVSAGHWQWLRNNAKALCSPLPGRSDSGDHAAVSCSETRAEASFAQSSKLTSPSVASRIRCIVSRRGFRAPLISRVMVEAGTPTRAANWLGESP